MEKSYFNKRYWKNWTTILPFFQEPPWTFRTSYSYAPDFPKNCLLVLGLQLSLHQPCYFTGLLNLTKISQKTGVPGVPRSAYRFHGLLQGLRGFRKAVILVAEAYYKESAEFKINNAKAHSQSPAETRCELHVTSLNDVSWTVLNSPSMCDHRYKVLLTRVHYTSVGVNGNVGRENPHDLDDSVSSHGPTPRAK